MYSQSFKRRLRHALHALRSPRISRDRLVNDIRALGVAPGDILMVHSSLSRLGFVSGGSETVINALLDLVGPTGTLVLPTHTWDQPALGNFRFDIRHSPSCVGAISETFRRWPGAIRSLHPTHSVAALGPRAAEICSGHEEAMTPCGAGSPYEKLLNQAANVLFLGVDLDSNTLFHTFEAYRELPYLMRPAPEEFEIVDETGTLTRRKFRRHDRGPTRRFAETKSDLLAAGAIREGKVGASASILVDSCRMAQVVMDRLAVDPSYLVKN